MVSETRKKGLVHLDYVICIEEIRPWRPSRLLRGVVIEWEHGVMASGITKQVVPSLGSGRIAFNQSFRLKGGGGCIHFNVYEAGRDGAKGGQLVGSAVLDLAAYGVIKENVSVSAPINCCKRTYRNSVQPLVFLRIQPREAAAESVSALMTEEYAEEALVDDTCESHLVNSGGNSSHSSSIDLSSDIAWISKRITSQSLQAEKHHSKVEDIQENVVSSQGDTKTQLGSIFSSPLRKESKTDNEKYVEEERRIKEEEGQNINDLTLENGLVPSTKESVVVHTSFSNIDRSKNGKSVRSLMESTIKEGRGCRKETRNHSRMEHVEQRIKVLKGELREAAAMEVSLYCVVAEHGSSMNKVHAPARRLSRLYFHANKHNPKPATSVASGLVLVAKACGNDVPRLTFWLSNTIVLRVIITSKLPISNRKKNASAFAIDDWFVAALEKIEAWIFSRIIESLWWQTFTPHMQQADEHSSLELWKKAFKDACERICPVRAGGDNCGCLPLLSKLIMEQLTARLDVAMFNAILRESADEMPTDPLADPITDAKVLPIPPAKASFGAGAQLKNTIGNWSRWLTHLFGMDDDDHDTSSKSFHLLNMLSDLMMLPKDMLLTPTIRKEVCPAFGAPLIARILNSFVPDEFCPDPIPLLLLESLNSEDPIDLQGDSIINLPCLAAPVIYQTPSIASLASALGGIGSHSKLTRSGSSLLNKSQTSDDELDELNSPLKAIMLDSFQSSPSSVNTSWVSNDNGSQNTVRYRLLRDVWMDA